jgi:hypothetical protein
MKHSILFTAVAVIAVIALIGAIYVFMPPQTTAPELQLDIDNLTALTDGKVSFNVTLTEGESGTIESVLLNNTRYNWSDGSQENQTILKGETRQWTKNIGELENGTSLEIVVETTNKNATTNVTVSPSPSENQNSDGYTYDNTGGVGLFTEGIHVVATEYDPDMMSYPTANHYWTMMHDCVTTNATTDDYITIILSRGDKPTGGYTINIENFAWLESYPVKFQFQVNVTDPGDGIMVTQAITNPLVVVPIGKLSAGTYNIEVNITWFTQNVDENGTTTYTPIMTFAPIVWKQTLDITNPHQNSITPTSFDVNLNGNPTQNLTVHVDLGQSITQTQATLIVESAFNQTMGTQVMHQLDTLTYNATNITAHCTWGYDETDMGTYGT